MANVAEIGAFYRAAAQVLADQGAGAVASAVDLVNPERLQQQLLQGIPLMAECRPQVAPGAFAAAVQSLAHLLDRQEPDQAPQLQGLERVLGTGDAALTGVAVRGDAGGLYDWAAARGVDPARVYFLTEMAVRPFLRPWAEELSLRVDLGAWMLGPCPLCSRRPDMGRIDPTGRRYLHCPGCGCEWPYRRIQCVHCGTDTPHAVHYFTVEGDDQLRVEVCDHCKGYIKVLDEQKGVRPGDLFVLDGETGHLDILAQEQGYTRTPATGTENQ